MCAFVYVMFLCRELIFFVIFSSFSPPLTPRCIPAGGAAGGGAEPEAGGGAAAAGAHGADPVRLDVEGGAIAHQEPDGDPGRAGACCARRAARLGRRHQQAAAQPLAGVCAGSDFDFLFLLCVFFFGLFFYFNTKIVICVNPILLIFELSNSQKHPLFPLSQVVGTSSNKPKSLLEIQQEQAAQAPRAPPSPVKSAAAVAAPAWGAAAAAPAVSPKASGAKPWGSSSSSASVVASSSSRASQQKAQPKHDDEEESIWDMGEKPKPKP